MTSLRSHLIMRFLKKLESEKVKKFEKILKTKFYHEGLVLCHSFNLVALSYLNYIFDIHAMYNKCAADDKPVYKEKFVEVRSELMQFLERHSQLARVLSLEFNPFKQVCLKINFGSLTTAETFLDFDKFADYYRQVRCYRRCHSCYSRLNFVWRYCAVDEFLKGLYEKPSSYRSISPERVCFLNYPEWKETKCSHEQLRGKIERRRKDLISKTVSKARIEELSFTLGSTKASVAADEKCLICLGGFEVDQQVSKMPCGHLFHKDCIAEWLKLPERQSKNSEYFSAYISAFSQVEFTTGVRPRFMFETLNVLNHYARRDYVPKFQCPHCRCLCC